MLGKIVPQNEEDVKSAEECSVEWCHEYVFRDGLCLFHFVEIETMAWDDQDAERQMVLETIGYVFGDRVEVLA